ncbi:MAG: hypothetical protein ACYTG3_13095 [Planctomycetota bacterium]|jgi:hypothetical protein
MLKRMLWLLLFAGAVFAQDDEEDDGIEIDSVPDAEEPEDSSKPAKKPTQKRGKRPGTVLFTARMYQIELPEAWEPKLIDAPKFELAWNIKIPGSKLSASLALNRDDKMASARATPRHWRESALNNLKGTDAKLVALPLPQLIVYHPQGDQEAVTQYVFRKIRGNPYYLLFRCGKETFAAAQPEIVAAMKSLKSTAKRFPSIPKDYVVKTKGCFLIAKHPSVKRSLKGLQKILKAQEKRFKKAHGALPKMKEPAVVIFVHNTKRQAGDLLKEAEKSQTDFYVDIRHGRLFAVPVTANMGDPAAYAAAAFQQLFILLKYGDTQPQWLWSGEALVARAAQATGKALPNLHAGFANWIGETKVGRLDDLAKITEENKKDYGKLAFYYSCMFHAGKYKKQYKKFLKEYGETLDWQAAFANHLEPIGYGALKSATEDFMYTKIKAIQQK